MEATDDCEIAYISKEALLEIFRNNRAFLLAYLKIQADFGMSLNSRIKMLSLASAKERLLYYLEDHGGAVRYDTVTSLAKELGLERETLSRTITALINDGSITKGSNTLKLRY